MPLSCQNLSTEVKRGSVVCFPIHEKKLRHQTGAIFFSLAPVISITRSRRITRMENVETKKKKKKIYWRTDGWMEGEMDGFSPFPS